MAETRKLENLKPHSVSLGIYGENEDVSDLAASIREHGILTPIDITPDGTILSGHRRFFAAKELGLAQVPCRVITLASAEEESVYIVEANRSRVKTKSQLYREGAKLKEALEAIAKRNSVANLKQGSVFLAKGTSPDPRLKRSSGSEPEQKQNKNPTRATIADVLGMSDSLWERLDYVGRLAKMGNETAIDAMLQMDRGEMTVTKAERAVRAAVKKEAGSDGEPEREPTFQEICRVEAEKLSVPLSKILRSVLALPDDEFNFAMWFAYSEDLDRLAARIGQLDEKIWRKARKCVDEFKPEPEEEMPENAGGKETAA